MEKFSYIKKGNIPPAIPEPVPCDDHRKEFDQWRKQREAAGASFHGKLSDVALTGEDIQAGDTVLFTNDYGVAFGHMEVLAFCEPWESGNCVYLNKDSY